MDIGELRERLSVEFPDITISKIRFLESEGYVSPMRDSEGRRRFSGRDSHQIRMLLLAQRQQAPFRSMFALFQAQTEDLLAGVHTPWGTWQLQWHPNSDDTAYNAELAEVVRLHGSSGPPST